MNLSNTFHTSSATNQFANSLSLTVSQLTIRNEYDGHVLATTLLPALLEAGYEFMDLRAEAVEDLRNSVQPRENYELLLAKLDVEHERFILGHVTEVQMQAARNLLANIPKPTSKKGTPVAYTPSTGKGFKHTPSVMSGTRALRMLNNPLPELMRTYVKTFI